MKRTFLKLALAALVSGAGAQGAHAQGAPRAARAQTGFDILQGSWVRPDGGYTITIKSVDAGGELDAAYANPRPLPFTRAEATREGKELKVFLELRAGGYNGSTYTLVYDAANDFLKGVYYQAVAQQKFDVYFERAAP
jgi:hypothetical protein